MVGLKQYAITFPATWDNAEELEKIYAGSQQGDPRLGTWSQSKAHSVSMNSVSDGETTRGVAETRTGSEEPAVMRSIEEQMWQGGWKKTMWQL